MNNSADILGFASGVVGWFFNPVGEALREF